MIFVHPLGGCLKCVLLHQAFCFSPRIIAQLLLYRTECLCCGSHTCSALIQSVRQSLFMQTSDGCCYEEKVSL